MKQPTARQAELVKEIMARLEAMKQIRLNEESAWEEITKIVLPRISDIKEEHFNDVHRRVSDNFDSTGRNAVRLWSNGMQGYMTPRNSPWVAVTMANRENKVEKGVRKYLGDVTEALLEQLRRSNFYDALGPAYEHGVTIGTSTTTVSWDEERGTLVYIPRHPKQVYIAENHHGRVDTVYTVEEMTWRQIVERFGEDALEENEIETAKRQPFEYKQILHAVFPRTDRIEGKVDAQNKRFASIWILIGASRMLRESGYDHMRDIVWRFRVGPGSPYGTGPSHDALIDLLRAEKINETMLRAADLAVRPPLMFPAELEGRLKLNPHGMTPYYDPRRQVMPLFQTGQYPYGLDREQSIQEAIRQHYRIDFWLMLSQSSGNKTAYEVAQIAGEKAAVMGAEIGRVESELLDPILTVTLHLLEQNGMLPELPDSLQGTGVPINYAYDGPLAQMQKRHYGTQNIIQVLSQVTLIAQVFGQSLDWIDDDELMQQALRSLDAPEGIIREKQIVAQIREARQQMEQAQMQLQMQKQAAEVQTELAKAQQAAGGAAGTGMMGGM